MAKRTGFRLLVLIVLLTSSALDAHRSARTGHTDLPVYQAASRALAAGGDPYAAQAEGHARYVYPPLLSVLLMPIAEWEVETAAFVFYLLSMAAFLASLWLVARLPFGGEGGLLGERAVLVAFLLCVGFAQVGLRWGHLTHLLLVMQVGALALCVRRHYLGAGLLLALGAALRLTPLIPAGAVLIGLAAGVRRLGWKPVTQYGAGLATGIVVFVWLVPLLALGSAHAAEVNARGFEVTRDVYFSDAAPEQLLEAYGLEEFRFENQAPRRVLASWGGKLGGVAFENSVPRLPGRGWPAVNVLARFVGLAVLITLAFLAWYRMNNPGVSQFVATFALALFAQVLVTRYTWPTHFVMALPMFTVGAWLALRGEGAARRALLCFIAGALLFYAAFWEPLRIVGGAGPLLFASLIVVVVTARALFRRPA